MGPGHMNHMEECYRRARRNKHDIVEAQRHGHRMVMYTTDEPNPDGGIAGIDDIPYDPGDFEDNYEDFEGHDLPGFSGRE